MLTGSRSIGRSSANISIRSTSATMRSASSQIRRVSARSSSSASVSRSCAAPRMPDSGFLISWASMAARPVTVRAAPRCVSWRSIFSVTERTRSISDDVAGRSDNGRGVDVDDALAADPRRADVDAVFGDRSRRAPAPGRSARTAGCRTGRNGSVRSGRAPRRRALEEVLRRLVRAGDAAVRRRSRTTGCGSALSTAAAARSAIAEACMFMPPLLASSAKTARDQPRDARGDRRW